MNPSEQADFSAERTRELGLKQQLQAELSDAGSILGYAQQIGETYFTSAEHKPNLLHMQRRASAIVNPFHEEGPSKKSAHAFYWGEILGYHVQNAMSGNDSQWAKDAYRIFSKTMNTAIRSEYIAELGSHEARQAIADEMLGDVEEPDIESMPRAMDELIIEWTEELVDNDDLRWHMILGFRHVAMQVQRLALGAEAERLKQDDAQKSFKIDEKILKKFLKLMDISKIDDVQAKELWSIDYVREEIMSSYADHRIAYGQFDESDDEAVHDAGTYLNKYVRQDFESMEGGLKDGDLVKVEGNAAFLFFNEEASITDIRLLGKNESLLGTVRTTLVTEVPTLKSIARLRIIADNQVDEYIPDDEYNPLGVILLIDRPVIITAENNYLSLGETSVTGVIMNNPDMHLSKHLL